MKKIFTLALVAMVALSASAAKKKAASKDANKPVFTVIKENPITSIKNQSRSGTCWNFSTLSFFEAEVLKATGKTYDFDEAFVENKTYMERAIQVVRYHGDCQFAQGGSAEDVLATMKTYGIIPEGIMPFAGSLYGDSLNNFNEFFSILEPYVAARLVSRVFSMHTLASVLRSSISRARSTLQRASWLHWALTSTIMYQSPAIPTTHSTPHLQ